jgi:hypothetical protein
MALQDLYGIGKGEAQLIDLGGVKDAIAQEQDFNRKQNAKAMADKATKAAALNALDDKLKNEAWTNHNDYVQKNLDEVRNWANQQYAKNGEMVFAENPALAREWQNKINDFKSLNEWSAGLKTFANKQLERSKGNELTIDPNSLSEFNEWLSMSPEQQRVTPMPIIKDRMESSAEVAKKTINGAGLAKVVGGSSQPDEKGRYITSSGTKLDEDKVKTTIDDVYQNTEHPLNISSRNEVLSEMPNTIAQYVSDENGEQVINPRWQEEYSKRLEERISENVRAQAPKVGVSSRASYVPGSGSKKEVNDLFDRIEGDNAGMKITGSHKDISESGFAEKGYRDASGNTYIKTSKEMYVDANGVLAYKDKEEIPKGARLISAGSYINRKGEEIDAKDIPNLKEVTQTTTYKTGEPYSVDIDEKSDLSELPYTVDKTGKIKQVTSEQGLSDAKVTEYTAEVKYKEDGGRIFYEGSDEYENSDKEAKTEDFIKVKTKGGFVTTPYTKEVAKKMPKLAEKINSLKQSGNTDETKSSAYVINGKEYSLDELKGMGYTEEQVVGYKK